MRSGLAAVVAVVSAFAAAGCGDRELPAVELGARLFGAPSLSTSAFNKFSCATCHSVAPDAGLVPAGRWDSGYNLWGVAGRPSWWGRGAFTLLDAINVCMEQFMGGRALVATAPETRQLAAYLAASTPDGPQPEAPLTIVRVVTPLDGLVGDAGRGAIIYTGSCARCHGAAHSGAGRLDTRTSIIPEDTIRFFPQNARAAVIEKIRHGKFFNIGGVMPFYSGEALSDQDIVDVLAYIGL